MNNPEKQVRSAIERGDFDDLPGKGEPLQHDQYNSLAGEWQLAYHLLASNGFTLPWIEQRNEILADLTQLQKNIELLTENQDTSQAEPSSKAHRDLKLEQAKTLLNDQITSLNQRIRDFNLATPGARFQISPINREQELARLTT